jgi:hypothetical protein
VAAGDIVKTREKKDPKLLSVFKGRLVSYSKIDPKLLSVFKGRLATFRAVAPSFTCNRDAEFVAAGDTGKPA